MHCLALDGINLTLGMLPACLVQAERRRADRRAGGPGPRLQQLGRGPGFQGRIPGHEEVVIKTLKDGTTSAVALEARRAARSERGAAEDRQTWKPGESCSEGQPTGEGQKSTAKEDSHPHARELRGPVKRGRQETSPGRQALRTADFSSGTRLAFALSAAARHDSSVGAARSRARRARAAARGHPRGAQPWRPGRPRSVLAKYSRRHWARRGERGGGRAEPEDREGASRRRASTAACASGGQGRWVAEVKDSVNGVQEMARNLLDCGGRGARLRRRGAVRSGPKRQDRVAAKARRRRHSRRRGPGTLASPGSGSRAGRSTKSFRVEFGPALGLLVEAPGPPWSTMQQQKACGMAAG